LCVELIRSKKKEIQPWSVSQYWPEWSTLATGQI